jgi:hypothetical protein
MIPSFYDPDYDYLWSDMSTGNVVDVEKAGWYTVRVTATRGNGCISRDSSYVLLLFNDIGIDSLVYPYNHCGLGNTEYVQLQVRNFGTDSLPGGEKIAVAFTLNGGTAVTDTLVLAERCIPGKGQFLPSVGELLTCRRKEYTNSLRIRPSVETPYKLTIRFTKPLRFTDIRMLIWARMFP